MRIPSVCTSSTNGRLSLVTSSSRTTRTHSFMRATTSSTRAAMEPPSP